MNSTQELRAHYAGIRDRLWNPKNQQPQPDPEPQQGDEPGDGGQDPEPVAPSNSAIVTVNGLVPPPVKYQTRGERIRIGLAKICQQHQISRDELLGTHRGKRFVAARRDAARMLRDGFGLSYPQIGDIMNRDHSTILNLMKMKERPSE